MIDQVWLEKVFTELQRVSIQITQLGQKKFGKGYLMYKQQRLETALCTIQANETVHKRWPCV